MPRVPSASAAMVMKLRDASPVTRFPMLTPPRLSSPSPFETRRTISAASCGRFETSRRRVAFSYQRKAGMRSLSPCRMPAWLADVCEGSITSQRPSRIRRARSQRDMTGTRPARTWLRSTGWLRPSILTITSPGWSGGRAPRAPERSSDIGDVDAGDERTEDADHEDLEDDRRDADEEERDRRDEREEDRPHQRVEEGDDDDRDGHRGAAAAGARPRPPRHSHRRCAWMP